MRATALVSAHCRATPSLLVVAQPFTAFSAEAGSSPFSARPPASPSCLRLASCRAESSSSPPLWPALQTTRAAFLLAVSSTSGQRYSSFGFPLEVSRCPLVQSRPRGFPRVSVRVPTFGVPKCRSRGSLGLVSLCCLRIDRVCRPLRRQSCSSCPSPVRDASGALSMCMADLLLVGALSGPAPSPRRADLPTRGRATPDWIRDPLPCGLGLSSSSGGTPLPHGGAPPFSGGTPLPDGSDGPAGGVGQAACLPPDFSRSLAHMVTSRRHPRRGRGHGPWSGLLSVPPASTPQLHSVESLPAASSAHLNSASMSATSAGPIPLPSAPASWCGAVGAGGRLPKRKTKRWCSTSKNRWAAPPLGGTSRRARWPLASGPKRESDSLG